MKKHSPILLVMILLLLALPGSTFAVDTIYLYFGESCGSIWGWIACVYSSANGFFATAGGGNQNLADGHFSTVGGGQINWAPGDYATVGGGGPDRDEFSSQVSWALELGSRNIASGDYSTVGGGSANHASSNYAIVGGGRGNTASGLYAIVGGGRNNTAGSVYATAGGGIGNNATGVAAMVGGGVTNNASGHYATVGGGSGNRASGLFAMVGGGGNNTASGYSATVAGGFANIASGNYSFAAGISAHADHAGSFVWADSMGIILPSNAVNQFVARASGGFYFYTNSTATSGATLPAGGGSWSNLSDRNSKDNFIPVDTQVVLQQVLAMPISTWNYQSQDAAIRHIGPMAQDFYASFGVGEDNTHISTVDADGVALAAIQGLYQVVQDKEAQISYLQTKNTDLQTRLDDLEARMTALENSNTPVDTRLFQPWMLAGGLVIGGVYFARRKRENEGQS